MNEIGMNDETKKLYHQYLEAKATIDDLEKKISLIRPYYERTKALYDNARLAELKSMDYQTFLKTDEWQRKRLDAIENARGQCERCGSKDGIQVHHKTYERRGEELPEDLIVLCLRCHKNEHHIS